MENIIIKIHQCQTVKLPAAKLTGSILADPPHPGQTQEPKQTCINLLTGPVLPSVSPLPVCSPAQQPGPVGVATSEEEGSGGSGPQPVAR